MSAATSTVSAAPPAPAPGPARPAAADQAPGAAPTAGPVHSFTEVLSAQRAETPPGGDRHDAESKRDPSRRDEADGAEEGRPSPASVPLPPPAASPVGAGPVAARAVALPPGVDDRTEASTPAPEGGEIAAAPVHSTHPPEGATATAPEDTGASGAEVSTVTAAAVDLGAAAGRGPDAAGPPGAVVPPSAPAEGSAVLGYAGPRSSGDSLPVHGAAAGEPAPAAAHPASTTAAPAGLLPAPSTPAPVAHLGPESPLGPAGAARAGGTVSPVGGTAGPSAPTMAQQAASALDVDDLSASISRPLSDGNGTYTVTVALHPPELGHLQAVLSLEGNDLSVSLTAQTQSGHDAVANAAEALKNQLARGGVNVNVTLRDPGSHAGQDERYRPPTSTGIADPLAAEGAATETPLSSGLVSGQIHLVL
jgi:hypothetical protein